MKNKKEVVFGLVLLLSVPVFAQQSRSDRKAGRPAVPGTSGLVTAGHPLAAIRPGPPARRQVQSPQHLSARPQPLPVLQAAISSITTQSRSCRPPESRRPNDLGQYRFSLSQV